MTQSENNQYFFMFYNRLQNELNELFNKKYHMILLNII